MKLIYGCACAGLLLAISACHVVDSGPTQTSSQEIDAGAAESVRAEISMGAGTLKIEGGAPKLMSAQFRYSEQLGQPVVHYEVTGSQGHLTVESPKSSSSTGNTVNEWDLRMGSGVPLDLKLALGAGESTFDLSRISLRSLEVNMGAGEMDLNMAGRYTKDVTVELNGGVGEARIRLPRDTGAVVQVEGGLGGVSAKGLTKRDGKYYNDAFSADKPAVRMNVHGGIGNVSLSVGESQPSN